MKHLTRILLFFGILTAFVLVTATYAEHSETTIAYPVTGGNIYFDKATGTVTGWDGAITEALIPEKIEGVPVTVIGTHAFRNCETLQNATIPNGVTSLEEYSFAYCFNLANTEIPDSVTSIGGGTFFLCRSLKNAKLSANVALIGKAAFAGCRSLSSIDVVEDNEHYVSVNGVLFDKSQKRLMCYPAGKAEMSYAVPNGVASIDMRAFYSSQNLQSVEIPNSITSIEWCAFTDCLNLKNIRVEQGHARYSSLDGVLFNRSKTTLICYPAGKPEQSYSIPNSVISMEDCAFAHCSALTSVQIPNGVTDIGNWAFEDCSKLRDAYYGGSEEEWEQITHLADSDLISDNITIHYNSAMPDTPSAPGFEVKSAPTVDGHAIGKANLGGLTKIVVPLSVSADTPAQITLCVPFYDGNGKFVGMGIITQTVDKNTTSVAVPVAGDMSGSEKLSVIILDEALCPLSGAYSCPIA